MLTIILGTIVSGETSYVFLVTFIALILPIQLIRVFVFKVKPMSLIMIVLTILILGIFSEYLP